MMKEYLGDSVYAELDFWFNIVLTTENGMGASCDCLELLASEGVLYPTKVAQMTVSVVNGLVEDVRTILGANEKCPK